MRLIKDKEDKKVYSTEKNGLTYFFTVLNLADYVNNKELYKENAPYWALTHIIALNTNKEKVYESNGIVGESGNYIDLRLKKGDTTRSISLDDSTNTIISDSIAYKNSVYYSEEILQNPYTITGFDSAYFEKNINFVSLLDNSKLPTDEYPNHIDVLYFLAANNLFKSEEKSFKKSK